MQCLFSKTPNFHLDFLNLVESNPGSVIRWSLKRNLAAADPKAAVGLLRITFSAWWQRHSDLASP